MTTIKLLTDFDQGQEIGTKNPKLSNNIEDYPGVQSRQIYNRLRKEGKTKKQAMRFVKLSSRDNARQPIDWGEYILQNSNPESTLNFYRKITKLWREDPVIAEGKLKVRKISNKGIFDFDRIYKNRRYKVHLDFSEKTISTLTNDKGDIILKSR